MTLLETGFAAREAGPDYINNTMTDLLFEEWSYAWSPRVEGRLIELAAYADRIDAACLAVLPQKREELQARGQGRDIAAMTDLLAHGLLAGIGAELVSFVQTLGADSQSHADFTAVAEALRRLFYLARSKGPMAAPVELDLTVNYGKRYSDKDCFENLLEVWTNLGRQPSYQEMKTSISKVGAKAYINRWGTWLKACQAFVILPILKMKVCLYRNWRLFRLK